MGGRGGVLDRPTCNKRLKLTHQRNKRPAGHVSPGPPAIRGEPALCMLMYIAQVLHKMLMLPTSRENAENCKRDSIQTKACTGRG